jgi:hypothetical protein
VRASLTYLADESQIRSQYSLGPGHRRKTMKTILLAGAATLALGVGSALPLA